jgi:fluoride exporter
MREVLFTAGFGALGCVARNYLLGWVYSWMRTGIPCGTFTVNVIGAFLIGIVIEFSLRSTLISQNLRIGLTIGFMG